jgi:hypothetical protein
MDRKNLILVGLGIAVLGIFIVGLRTNSDRGVGTGQEYSPPDGPAIITNGGELFSQFDSGLQYDSLRRNLAFFARATIKEYGTGQQPEVVFTIGSDVKKDDRTITFDGSYDKAKGKIRVSVTLLGSNQLKLSVTNLISETNIDAQLPANKPESQFIGSLPYETALYRIEYNASVGTYIVTALSPEQSVRSEANNYIVGGTGKAIDILDIIYQPYLD